jgi:hypothetical protein
MKMEATCSSEASVDFQRTAWLYVPEYKNGDDENSIVESRDLEMKRHQEGICGRKVPLMCEGGGC